MGILGKDLIALSDNFFEFTALFSNSGVEINEKGYRYAEITTAFLNYDSTEYKKVMGELKTAHDQKDEKRYIELTEQINDLIMKMSLFRDWIERHDLLKYNFFNPFMQEEWTTDPYRNCSGYLALEEDLDLIIRYQWFLKEIFYRDLHKSGPNKYAWQIEENGMSGFVSGRSLGKSSEVDQATTSVQYEVRVSEKTGEPQLYEKMVYKRLSDFLYTELFKAMMMGNVPKQCRLCGRYFLQEKGFDYEYCDGIAPGETTKTCRDVGSTARFREKVKNNEIWKIHQRAYKKYYARVLKKNMSKPAFNEWAQAAEKLRDETLLEMERARKMNRPFPLDDYIAALNKD
jgi:hypothetical protein